jgi:hypothetical protein
MKVRRILAFVLAIVVAGMVFADFTEDVTALFTDFLERLAAKHEELEGIDMSVMQITDDGVEDINWAAVILTFENPVEAKMFSAALEAEDIPCFSFPEEEKKVLLISVDMMVFVMQDAIGL